MWVRLNLTGKKEGYIEWQNWRKVDYSMIILLTMCNSHVKVNVHARCGHYNRDDDLVHTPSWLLIPHAWCQATEVSKLLPLQLCVCVANVLPVYSSYHFLKLG